MDRSQIVRIPDEHIRQAIFAHGRNTHSFLTLYSGFSWFVPVERKQGVVGFCDTPGVWVAGAEPMLPAAGMTDAFTGFAAAAREFEKKIVFLPVSRSAAEAAVEAGYGAIQFGCEPIFDLSTYEPKLDHVSTAAVFFKHGARVHEFKPHDVAPEKFNEMDQIYREWVDTRSLPALKYMNQAEPWIHPGEKRYFYCEHEGRIVAFASAVPFDGGRGWYFVDVLRGRNSRPGSTELLILEGMRMLKEDGVRCVSLGVATLSGIDSCFKVSKRRSRAPGWMDAIMMTLRERGDLLFRFKPLHRYKMKFHPTSVEPVYIVYFPPPFRAGYLFAILHALFGSGMLAALVNTIRRALSLSRLAALVRAMLSDDVIPRALPSSPHEMLRGARATLLLLTINVAVYVSTTVLSHWHLPHDMANEWGFTVMNLRQGNWWTFFTSGLLHEVPAHMFYNGVIFVPICGGLELVLGTRWMLAAYALGALAANPLFASLFVLPLSKAGLPMALQAASRFDVGASLGIAACLGALIALVGRPLPLILFFTAWVIGTFVFFGCDLWQFNHIVSLALGYLFIRWRFR